ncbi:uncharacterized protein LOC130973806 isoform X1 [Arachis stenosperma]|uniref:uncharacterized protein LOC130973806 isoform X1 n=1 Tax=Arachis stenosperma TaxID=217475 RepID=UPI0025AD2B08|nr:uncharacterized protein LOC130973806 isoform X1 [Arachis stenosperma]
MNKDEVRTMLECYRRIKLFLSKKEGAFIHTLEQSFFALINAFRGTRVSHFDLQTFRVKTLALDSLAISMPPSQGRESLPSLMTPTFAKEERHLLERNMNVGLQQKIEELQKNLMQVTHEKVKALVEFAQLK